MAGVTIERRLIPFFDRLHLHNAGVQHQNVERPKFVPNASSVLGAQVASV